MPDINVEIWCSCGAGLCNQSSTNKRGDGIIVDPCEVCLDNARGEAKDEGYEQGANDKEKELEQAIQKAEEEK